MQVVAGGGAVEAALSVYLENLATTLGSREQLAIAEFAESLLIIPKVIIIQLQIPSFIFIWAGSFPRTHSELVNLPGTRRECCQGLHGVGCQASGLPPYSSN